MLGLLGRRNDIMDPQAYPSIGQFNDGAVIIS